ncbi:disks large-associated protein 5 isoform X2 [Cygnus olor]|nr:disks large-associated protein 5 isoform X2 [Cygnus olor]XP_040414573.1 disks large-associated protein 5 isoform X2 [Cygnus olor]XP_040414574.1 disks large-associated protein 5 isoform X2 [Cygnus olor]XP_040414575.1 disks large-associated protein 5 isoform X2 [Cygnus olor]XP_040414577.1 disks large-associated protein 5 isoform X2 [Cygnus olor]
MAATSQFASRYKKDLSTETIRTKVARRKSVLQKENRHKLFEKGRQFGLADVNVQLSKDRGVSQRNETSEMCSQENSSVKQKQPTDAATKRINDRKEMLQRYKEEKELRKLREQREKAKKGVFKVGLYRPTAPGFLSLVPEDPVTVKPREKAAPAFSGRITRSKAKNQAEKAMIPTTSKPSTVCANGHSVRPTQAGCKQKSTDKMAEKGKVLQTAVQTAPNVRITRAASSAARQMPKTTATAGNQSQRKTANVAKEKKAVKPGVMEVIPFEHKVNENAQLDPVMCSASELREEQTSEEKKNNSAPGRPRTRSFAPQNFVFQPLDGITTYKVKPMTPSRANAFLTPNAFWDFSKSPVNIVEKSSKTRFFWEQEPDSKSQISPFFKDLQEQQITASLKGEQARDSDEKTSIQRSNETIPVSTDVRALETKSDDIREQEHDVPYFRNILQSETERLMSQCLQWDGKLELDIPEDAKDLIRTTVGQTRLLIAERFKQFEGLVDNCEFKRGEKETTCTDLDGFWDMIYFQIEDVNKKFDNLKMLQDNEWQPLDVPSKEIVKKKTVPNGVSKPKLGAAGRTAARNRLAAVKAAMRDKMKNDGAADCTPQNKLPEVEKVVFEAGFFRIESPVKNFPDLLSKKPHRSSQQTSEDLATPRSSSRTLQSNSSLLCNPEDTTAKQTTPALKGFQPAQNLNMHQFTTGKTLPSGCLEHSVSLDAEEPIPVAGTVEGSKVLENSNSELKVMDGTEEMELSAPEQQGQDIVMGSPEKEDTCTETNLSEYGEPKIQQPDVLCSDLTSIDRNPFDTPMLDGELPFTPVKNKVQKLAAAETFSDLIVFSPLPSSGEK